MKTKYSETCKMWPLKYVVFKADRKFAWHGNLLDLLIGNPGLGNTKLLTQLYITSFWLFHRLSDAVIQSNLTVMDCFIHLSVPTSLAFN